MELKEFLAKVQRWAWLLAVGLLVGLLGGYLASYYMEPVYEASSKIMISREIQDENPDFAGLNSQQLVQTYVQILKTKPLLDTTMEKVDDKIEYDQVLVQQILDTQIIEIKIEDHNPAKAAAIANTMVQVLIEQNGDMQTGQYIALEDRLTKQVEQIEAQIDAFQEEYDKSYELDYQDQLSKVDEQISEIQAELATLQIELIALKPQNSQVDQLFMAEKQIRIDQLQSMFVTYEQIRANLLIQGRPLQFSNVDDSPHLQRLQSTLDLYQELYLTLVEDLERVRLARLQQTPNIVHIEKAIISEKPVRPIPLLYTLISGIVGLMFSLGLVFFIEALQSEPKPPGLILYGGDPWQLEPPDATASADYAEAVQGVPEKKIIKVTTEAKRNRRASKTS